MTRNNSVKIDGNLNSTHDVNLYAGVNADGTDSVLNIKGLSASQNYTMFPFALPEVNLERKNKQQVTVGTSGSATAWRHINLSAVKGNETYRKDTKAHFTFCDPDKDDHHQFFTVTNLSGDSNVKSTDANYVNVEGTLKAGIQNNRLLHGLSPDSHAVFCCAMGDGVSAGLLPQSGGYAHGLH